MTKVHLVHVQLDLLATEFISILDSWLRTLSFLLLDSNVGGWFGDNEEWGDVFLVAFDFCLGIGDVDDEGVNRDDFEVCVFGSLLLLAVGFFLCTLDESSPFEYRVADTELGG